MNWRLLDIRTGRANRRQFFLIVLWFCAVNFLVAQFNIHILNSVIFVMTSYILILASLRRLRDIRHHKKWLIIFYVIIIFPYLSYYLVLIPIDNNVFSQFWNFLIIALFFGAHISAILFIPLLFFFLFMLVKIFTKGNPDENEYGLPPKGFDFNTMITDANYLKAKGIENAHAFLMEKDKEQFEQINVLR